MFDVMGYLRPMENDKPQCARFKKPTQQLETDDDAERFAKQLKKQVKRSCEMSENEILAHNLRVIAQNRKSARKLFDKG